MFITHLAVRRDLEPSRPGLFGVALFGVAAFVVVFGVVR